MSPVSPSDMALLEPDSASRPRSISMGDSELPEHEHKRPRLSEFQIDTPSSLPSLPSDAAQTSTTPVKNALILSTPPASPHPSSITAMATSPTSKVTINTRPLSSQSFSHPLASNTNIANDAVTPGDDLMGTEPASDSPVIVDVDPAESAHLSVEPQTVPDTISISSSPCQTPPIQIAEPEDFDENPSNTTWAPLPGHAVSDSTPIGLDYVARTFPYANKLNKGHLHRIIPNLAEAFEQDKEGGNLFLEIKSWLVNLVARCDHLTYSFIAEDIEFWQYFPRLANGLLSRKQDPPPGVNADDIVDFFVAYARLTTWMMKWDSQRYQSYPETADAKSIRHPLCLQYLPAVVLSLSAGASQLQTALQLGRITDANLMVGETFKKLTQTSLIDLVNASAALFEQLALNMPRKISLLGCVHQLFTHFSKLIQLVALQFNSIDEADSFLNINGIQQALSKFVMKVNEVLEQAIVKQQTWLTIENCRVVVDQFRTFICNSVKCCPEIGPELIQSAGVDPSHYSVVEVIDIVPYVWTFTCMQKFVRHGRMELRVYGIESMASDLLHVWQDHVQRVGSNDLTPLLSFLVGFIQNNQLIKYIIGVDSHPQIVHRSPNVIGFLCISRNWKDSDTDVVWHAILESQDPRTGPEVLEVLSRNLINLDMESLRYIYGKLLGLKFQCIDGKMLQLAQALLKQSAQKIGDLNPDETNPLNLVIIKLCLRLLREGNTPEYAWTDIAQKIRTDIPSYLQNEHKHYIGDFRVGMAEHDQSDMLKEMCADIESHGQFSCGSVIAMNALLASVSTDEFVKVVRDCDYTRLLVTDIAYLASRQLSPTSNAERTLLIDYQTRLICLSPLIVQVPETFTPDLIETLWTELLASHIPNAARAFAWSIFADAFNKCVDNSLLDTLLRNFFPRLPARLFDQTVLQFAERSVQYETRRVLGELVDNPGVMSFPGIERVWRIMLEAFPDTVEVEASDFIISQYLDSEVIAHRSSSSVESTHLSLIDRCVEQVIQSANKLKSFSNGISSVEDEPMLINGAEEEIHSFELRFNRSLLLLRKFLDGINSRPRYQATTAMGIQTLLDGFEKRGDKIELGLMVTGHPSIRTERNSWTVGSENTASELWQFLTEVTGWTLINIFKNGARVQWRDNATSLRDLKFNSTPVMVTKVHGSPEQTPTRSIRAASPLDVKVMRHFDDLYDLLEADNNLAKQVYEFLTMFSSQESILENLTSMTFTAEELLPKEKPFKLMYYARALRSCIETESFSSTPNTAFLSYAVHIIISRLPYLDSIPAERSTQISISQGLIEALLLAFRAKVPQEVSKEYISDHQAFVTQVLHLWSVAQKYHELEATTVTLPTFIRAPFEALIEASLHDTRVWDSLRSHTKLSELVSTSFITCKQREVRQSILDVIFGLTGSSSSKVTLKINDPRSPRSRFPPDCLEKCQKQLWEVLQEFVALACHHVTTCHEFFEALLALLRCTGATFDPANLLGRFEAWKVILLAHEHQQNIGHELLDHVVGGLGKVLCEISKLLSVAGLDIPGGKDLIQELFSRFLFPPLSESGLELSNETIPILDSQVRDTLYNLVLELSKDNNGIAQLAIEMSNDLIPRDVFPAYHANDRQSLRSEVGYAGLRNLSNTCYLNSMLTQLFMNVRLRDFILQINIIDETKQRLILELGKVFANMQNSYEKSVNPGSAIEAITQYDGEQIDVTVQMDVDEFFNLLFDRLESQIIDPNARNTFKSMYGGQLVQQIKSRECEHVSERLEPFSAVQIEIKGKLGLEEGLRAYVEGEVLQGENKYSCTGCGKHVDAVKRACLKDLPDNLIFNLKRFDYDIMTGMRCKINDEFQFPHTVNMAPYTIDALTNPGEPVPPDLFELVGVIIHSGTAESGHYYSYVRQRPSPQSKDNAWVQFNDQDVTKFDPASIRDCCFGGVDFNYNNCPKFYNGYMLFYQRSSSIHDYEQRYPVRDPVNPVQITLATDLSEYISQQNELFVRSFVAQDPVHLKFVRQLTERLRPTDDTGCSDDHETEDKLLLVALDSVQQLSSRWKEFPEFEDTMKFLNMQADRCHHCALCIADWYVKGDNMVDNIIRSFYQAARKAFQLLLSTCFTVFTKTKLTLPSNHVDVGMVQWCKTMEIALSNCLFALSEHADSVQRFSRCWDQYFGLLRHVVQLGPEQAYMILETDLFELALELVHVHVPSLGTSSKKLRSKYATYLVAREKNRPFGHGALLQFLADIMAYIDFEAPSKDHQRFQTDGKMGPTADEAALLGLATPQLNLIWLKKSIMGRCNPEAIDQMVRHLCGYRKLNGILALTLREIMSDRHMVYAASSLQPSIVYCQNSLAERHVVDLVVESLENIETINGTFGHDYIGYVYQLTKISNERMPFDEGALTRIVVEHVPHWAPVLLMSPNDIHNDTRTDTLNVLRAILLSPLDNASPQNAAQYRELTVTARKLAMACETWVRLHFLDPTLREHLALHPGQANQLLDTVFSCSIYFNPDNLEHSSSLARIVETMDELRSRADAVAEVSANDDWREGSSDFEQLSELESLEMSP